MIDQVFGIIPIYKKDGRYMFLLIKNPKGHWSFPKGHAYQDEKEMETAQREFAEETGITDYTFFSGISFSESYAQVRDGSTIKKTAKFFLAEVRDPTVRVTDVDEIVEHRWLYFPEALEQISYDAGKQLLFEVKSYLSKTSVV